MDEIFFNVDPILPSAISSVLSRHLIFLMSLIRFAQRHGGVLPLLYFCSWLQFAIQAFSAWVYLVVNCRNFSVHSGGQG